MSRPAGIAVILAAAAALASPCVADGTAGVGGFDTRYGVAPGVDLARLVDEPTVISVDSLVFDDEATGERRLLGSGESHAVVDAPLETMLACLLDYDSYPRFMPRVVECAIVSRTASGLMTRMRVGINFLGWKLGYLTVFEAVVDRLPGGAVGLRTRMVECLDGSLFASTTSWYLAPVWVGGRHLTYVRVYNRPGLRAPAPGVATILRTFTPLELAAEIQALRREARKRSGLPD